MADRLYERDPDTWLDHLAEGNARQARKRVAADVLIRDREGRILLVNPNYKPDWDLPGGMAEENEAPIDAARRELHEELGLTVHIRGLLCVDWVPPHGPWDDTLMFVFDGGALTPGEASELKLADHELDAFRFCSPGEAAKLLRPYVWDRTALALNAIRSQRVQYAHYGVAQNHGSTSAE